ncbi:MAG: peptidyl-prolyl cis-trans isomerase [Rhodospirillales bacterium]|jgi:peptidyl-prolyl cis-trans isomerase C|nr:peptidyl-prolyl cis-trans isomerase [Rhodospirillales bacterium]
MSAKIRASHILVSTDSRKKDVALTEIEALHKKITDGADFGEVASEASDCPSGSRGGDLGQFGRGMMVPEFEEAAFGLDVNAMSGVVETDFGYHLILRTE